MNGGPGELRLSPESIEALAARLAELIGPPGESPASPSPPEKKMISPGRVAELWGVSRRWVYDHAEELGARRLGSGPRPRLRFDPEEVAERLGAPARGPRLRRPDARGSTMFAGSRVSDSLSSRPGAIVAETQVATAGRRCNAPGPASKEMLRRAPQASPDGRTRPPSRRRMRGGDL